MDHGQTSRAPAVQSQTVEDIASHPEQIRILTPGHSGESIGITGRDTRSQSSSTYPLNPASEGHAAPPRSHENPYTDFERAPVTPARDGNGRVRVSSRRQTLISNAGLPAANQNTPGIDWIVPVKEKGELRRTVGERLQPTIDNAVIERDKYAKKALWTGYALNIAIGLQVFFGALTTGIAAAVTSGRQASGFSTMVASYMARARGSGEPEVAIARVKDLEQFLREVRAFQMDHAHEYSTPENGLGIRLEDMRRRFEEMLGNANAYVAVEHPGILSLLLNIS
ncbi:hypothetical protein HD554DRAFT_2026866 [Boletus coccyginus]|nr:hypothetical protein HD554DRAFT_2026866 [Boletus coccyginus]